MDLTRWNDGADAELEQLVGGDLELLDLGRRVRAARPEPRIDPDFQRRLRAQLMTAAETELRPRGLARLLRPRASLFAYGAAGLGTAMIAAATLAYYAPHSDHVTVVEGMAKINGQPFVSPDQVITISFNQAMDHSSVERGLTIQPAVTYKPSWQGNELIITPAHHLQVNSPYVVTIPKNAARDLKGDVATKDITITFGTSPVAPGSPAGPPTGPVTLAGHDAGTVGDGSLLGFTSDGSLLATAGLVPPAPTASAGGTTPGAGGTAATPAPPAPALVRYGSDGTVRLGDPVTAVALSPAGHSLATVGPAGDGVHSVVAVSDTDGSHRLVLSSAADAGSPVGWGGDATHPVVLFVSDGELTSIDLEHHLRTIPGIRVASGQAVRIAPGGRYVFVGPAPTPSTTNPSPAPPVSPLGPGPALPGVPPLGQGQVAPGAGSDSSTDAVPLVTSTTGQVVDLGGTTAVAAPPLPLTGLATGDLPGFSGDGRRVAWIESGPQPVIAVQPLDGSAPVTQVTLPKLATGDAVTTPTLDRTGDRVAYAITHADGGGELRLVRVGDGSLLATGAVHQPSGLVFSTDGTTLGYLQRTATQTVAEVATVPGAPTGGSSVPAAAAHAIDALVAAEVGDRSKLDGLVATAVEPGLLGSLPGGLSRGYVISAAPVAGSDGVTAQIRLLRDPTNDHPTAAFTDQKVALQHAGGDKYIVSASDIPRGLHDEPSGPQVVHVDTSRTAFPRTTTVRITFDSDLDPSSVSDPSLISLTGATSGLLAPLVSYDPASRTVTVVFSGRLHPPLDLTVGIGLRDVNGQGLAAPFTTEVVPSP